MSPTPSTALSRRRLLQAGVAAAWSAAMPGMVRAAPFQEITWDALVPRDWNPMESFRDLQKLGALPDWDPRVEALYDRMRKVWDEAPTVPALQGRQVRIRGFVVPLESGEKGLREFLLVPYFGACIHAPPPPANQIIHVRVDPPVRGFPTMSAVRVSGILDRQRGNTELGASGYSLRAALVERLLK